MRIKYFGTKVFLVLATVIATPFVWAALAWPEWSAASPADDAIEVASALDSGNQEPQVLVQPVIRHEVIVLPRYVYIEATPVPVITNPASAAPAAPLPANTPLTVPTPVPTMVLPPTPVPAPQQPQQTVSSGGSNSNGTSSNSSTTSSSSGNTSSSSSNNSGSTTSSSTSTQSTSRSTTKGS